MLLTEEEKKLTEDVKSALLVLTLGIRKDIIYNLEKILDIFNKTEIKMQLKYNELLKLKTDLNRRENIFKKLDIIEKSKDKIVRGWLEYLTAAILEDKNAKGDKFEFLESEPAKSFREICNKGFHYDKGNYHISIAEDKARLKRVRSCLEPKFNAGLISQKNKDLPGEAGAKAKFCIYQMYQKGEGCSKKSVKALQFLKESADAGLAEANYILATLYRYGNIEYGIEKDGQKAYEYYKKASMLFPVPQKFDMKWKQKALSGNPIAQHICAKSELSKDNIVFCSFAAKIAYHGPTGDNRRYYKAAREYYLYGIFKSYYDYIKKTKDKEKRKRQAGIKYAKLIEETAPFEPLTKRESAVLEYLKEELKS